MSHKDPPQLPRGSAYTNVRRFPLGPGVAISCYVAGFVFISTALSTPLEGVAALPTADPIALSGVTPPVSPPGVTDEDVAMGPDLWWGLRTRIWFWLESDGDETF